MSSHYEGTCNLDDNDVNKPGSAIVWLRVLEVEVTNLVPCRLQLIKVFNEQFVNVYCHSGTQGQRGRKILFGEDLMEFLLSSGRKLPFLVGDFNCVMSPSDVSRKVFGAGGNSPILGASNSPYQQKKSKELKDIISLFRYTDAFSSMRDNKLL